MGTDAPSAPAPPSLNTIQAWWELYERGSVHPQATEFQREQLRIAFYSGASGALAIVGGPLTAASPEAAVGIWQGLTDEIERMAEYLEQSVPPPPKLILPDKLL